ncbi:MAG TPA: hypothetical protein VF679_02085 [Pedobacter sp.]
MKLVNPNRVIRKADDDDSIISPYDIISVIPPSSDKRLKNLKIGIWAYFLLLILEGALRKWALPGLATPLLIVRDPIAIWLLYQSIASGIFKPNIYVYLLWILTTIAFLTTMFFGHGDVTVALFGARIFAFHFPVIFVIARVFDRGDVIAVGKWLLWISIGMTLLVAAQFFSPQSAWINRGIAGDSAGSGFSGAAGFYRVPGTFSFTNGLSLFYGFVAAFVFYFWIDNKDKKVPQYLLLISTFSLLAAVPLSISRTVLFEIAVSMAFLIVVAIRNPKFLGSLVAIIAVAALLLVGLSNFSFFQTATMAFTERFTTANEGEGGLEGVFIDRFLGGMVGALTSDQSLPFWGQGLGMGTNAGAKLLTGNTDYLISEGEWGRLIGEMGLILGLSFILLRLFLLFQLLQKSIAEIGKKNPLPWLLMSFAFLMIAQSQLGQPTSLGFTVLAAGLVLAAFKKTAQI